MDYLIYTKPDIRLISHYNQDNMRLRHKHRWWPDNPPYQAIPFLSLISTSLSISCANLKITRISSNCCISLSSFKQDPNSKWYTADHAVDSIKGMEQIGILCRSVGVFHCRGIEIPSQTHSPPLRHINNNILHKF